MNRIALLVGVTLAAPVLAQMSPQESAEFTAQIESMAKTYYPAIVNERNPPKDLLLGFLVDSKDRVLKHSIAIESPPPVAVADELKRMFPERTRKELFKNSAGCIFQPGTTKKQYCVVFAQVEP